MSHGKNRRSTKPFGRKMKAYRRGCKKTAKVYAHRIVRRQAAAETVDVVASDAAFRFEPRFVNISSWSTDGVDALRKVLEAMRDYVPKPRPRPTLPSGLYTWNEAKIAVPGLADLMTYSDSMYEDPEAQITYWRAFGVDITTHPRWPKKQHPDPPVDTDAAVRLDGYAKKLLEMP